MSPHTLIHTALVVEAKPIIGYFGLTCKEKKPFNIYANDDIVLIVSGIGSEKTKAALTYALTLFEPSVAINIGIAGCVDESVPKGKLFCATHGDLTIPFATLSSHDEPILNRLHVKTTLVDMEADAFLLSIPKGIQTYVFKVVSDHCESTIPSRVDVGNWIGKSIKAWENYVRF